MKRDFDLIRLILKDIEQIKAGEYRQEFSYSDYDNATVYHHIGLLIDAGLIKGQLLNEIGTDHPGVIVDDLTWTGHDFLDAMKDDTIWKKAKESVLKPTASITFDLLLEWLRLQVKEKIGIP